MKVLGNKVAAIPLAKAERSHSGLYIPQNTDSELVISGRVAAFGEEAKELLRIGDTVHFVKHNGFKVTVDGTEYRVMTLNDVLVVEESPKAIIEELVKETPPLSEEVSPLPLEVIETQYNTKTDNVKHLPQFVSNSDIILD